MRNPGNPEVLVVGTMIPALILSAAESQPLPWQREMPLREAAQTATMERTLNSTNPNSRFASGANNVKMHTVHG
jgi:hypothetical protein